MATTESSFRKKLDARLQDRLNVLKGQPAIDAPAAAIAAALAGYSVDKPRETSVLVPGTGAFDYAIASLTGWSDRFSRILALAQPYVATQQEQAWLDEGADFQVVRLSTGLFLRFTSTVPGTTESFQVTFTVPYASVTTLPDGDVEGVADLAAAEAFMLLSSFYSTQHTETSSIATDVFNRQSKASECRSLAKLYREAYRTKCGLGAGDAGPRAAATYGHIDQAQSDPMESRRMFHGRRRA